MSRLRDGFGAQGRGRDGVGAPRPSTQAVFFDVDFTLIYPGPTFQGVADLEET